MDPRGAPFLSIVLPAYNERDWLEPAVAGLAARMVAAGFPYEILVVDDGSTDGTIELAERIARRFDPRAAGGDVSAWAEMRVLGVRPNRGKGHAVRTGVLESRGRFVMFLDADLSTSPAYIPAFLVEAASGHDVVVASRHLPGSRTDPPQGLLRRLGGKVFRRLSLALLGLPPSTTDVTCGFKMFRGDVARALFARQRLERWGFDAEILFLAHRAGLSVRELPVSWGNRAASRVRLLRDALRSFAEILAVRRNAAAGLYGPPELPVPLRPAGAPSAGAGLEDGAQAGPRVGPGDARDLLGRS